jgi:uncharacterized protein YggE
MSERKITIQGKGRAYALPDRVVLLFRAHETHKEYETAVSRLNKDVEKLREDLEWLGVKRTDLKTSNFSVTSQYDYSLGKQRFNGYLAAHDLRLELPLSQTTLNQVLNKITNGQNEVEIFIQFEVIQSEELKQHAIENAVRDAQTNAETIAHAAGIKLGKIVEIHYGEVQVRVEYQPQAQAFRALATPQSTAAPDIQPQDIRADENVTVTWEIAD